MSGHTERQYEGGELEAFALATNWKQYLADQIRPFLGDDVVDVGAGLGQTALALGSREQRWLLLEPDPTLAMEADRRVAAAGVLAHHEIRIGTLAVLGSNELFDSATYVDVLEHIEHDRAEVASVVRHLRPGGHLVVLCPAHQFLFTAFDASIGHYRRYNRSMMKALSPPGATLVRLRYLDGVGLSASLANKMFLRQSMPTAAQIRFWDRLLVPGSRWLDPVLGYAMGKSILAVWRRDP
jgi:SAM-dependent methyltransferase